MQSHRLGSPPTPACKSRSGACSRSSPRPVRPTGRAVSQCSRTLEQAPPGGLATTSQIGEQLPGIASSRPTAGGRLPAPHEIGSRDPHRSSSGDESATASTTPLFCAIRVASGGPSWINGRRRWHREWRDAGDRLPRGASRYGDKKDRHSDVGARRRLCRASADGWPHERRTALYERPRGGFRP